MFFFPPDAYLAAEVKPECLVIKKKPQDTICFFFSEVYKVRQKHSFEKNLNNEIGKYKLDD